MQSTHSPVPPARKTVDDGIISMPSTEEFDDPFSNTMSSSNLDELALVGSDETDNAVVAADQDSPDDEEEADPWAVLAAAAGEEVPKSPPSPTDDALAAVVAATTPATISVDAEQEPITQFAHAEGETFTMSDNDNNATQPPSLAAQIQSSTANLSLTLTSKIQEVDAKTGISIKARGVDEQYHLSEKWTKTVEKTKEITGGVKEKVAPSVKEHWGAIKNRSVEMGITQKWSSLSFATRSRWNETTEKVGESVQHFKEEHEKKKAVANSNGEEVGGVAGLQPQLEATKEKVVESWTGGVNWVSQRIQNAKFSSELDNVAPGADKEMQRLDSDGLPSSFRKK